MNHYLFVKANIAANNIKWGVFKQILSDLKTKRHIFNKEISGRPRDLFKNDDWLNFKNVETFLDINWYFVYLLPTGWGDKRFENVGSKSF